MNNVCNFYAENFLLILQQGAIRVFSKARGLDRRETGLFYSTVYLMNLLYCK